MAVTLTKTDIDNALPRIAPGLRKYLWIQSNRDASDVRTNAVFRKRFNGFYRVRRGQNWQQPFYELLEQTKGKPALYPEVFDALRKQTGRFEASFASKLLATINPAMPVIDSIVLRNVGLRLPAQACKDRRTLICQLHAKLLSMFHDFLMTDDGKYLVTRFRESYPDAAITELKMLDLVLWQTRS